MSTHTPGPWHVANGCNVFSTNADGSSEYLAVTGGLSGRDTLDRDAANACLICAAPEMLEVLKWVRATYASAKVNARIDAVIAKAEPRP